MLLHLLIPPGFAPVGLPPEGGLLFGTQLRRHHGSHKPNQVRRRVIVQIIAWDRAAPAPVGRIIAPGVVSAASASSCCPPAAPNALS